jgi:hypothetical protein
MSAPSTVLRVNRDRLWSDLMQLKQIGLTATRPPASKE